MAASVGPFSVMARLSTYGKDVDARHIKREGALRAFGRA